MKRIAIFLDGTWNNLEDNTNVWRLKSLCDPAAPDQRVYYSKGVGTTFGETLRGGVEGYGIDREITDAYTWLVQTFSPGDEIFIFGFSRGAYTARSLSGLISKCGVLRPGAPLSIQQLYARYRRRTEPTIADLARRTAPSGIEERWILQYCYRTNIKMVGVWDTVGALGNPLSPMAWKVAKFGFLDTHLRLANEHAFHALAIDEHRGSFEPTPWTRTVPIAPTGDEAPPRPVAQVEQRWFVGAHANVGGGYPSDLLAQPSLGWLLGKASALGLAFRDTYVADQQDPAAPIADSYRQFAWGLGHLVTRPFQRPIGPPASVGTKWRTERINETIDASVFDRWRGDAGYRPANLADWARRKGVDPASFTESTSANDPSTTIPANTAAP